MTKWFVLEHWSVMAEIEPSVVEQFCQSIIESPVQQADFTKTVFNLLFRSSVLESLEDLI